jgi:quinol monooxygenase YgiN
MSKVGLYVKFTTHPGQRDALVALLLEAAGGIQTVESCELYIVNVSATEPETVWVTEVWSSAATHEASLTFEGSKAMIKRAMPLIAGVERIDLLPIGGKGLMG